LAKQIESVVLVLLSFFGVTGNERSGGFDAQAIRRIERRSD
jgi:hypothetical protein